VNTNRVPAAGNLTGAQPRDPNAHSWMLTCSIDDYFAGLSVLCRARLICRRRPRHRHSTADQRSPTWECWSGDGSSRIDEVNNRCRA
jgi:hypothetical protein